MNAPLAVGAAGRSCLAFYFTSYGLAVVLSLAIGLTGGHQSRFIGLGYLSMLIPTISVGITRVVTADHGAVKGWDRFSWSYLPAALFLMPIVLHAVMLSIAASLCGLHWQPWLSIQADGLFHSSASRGWGNLTPAGLTAHIAVNALVGVIVVSALALFEEIGWRAWLLPRLVCRMSARRAVVLSSAIWALWHVPFALSGILHVNGLSPFTVSVLGPVGVFGSGLVLGWLWLRTESVWIVAVAHGALNNWGQYAFKFSDTAMSNCDAVLLGAGGMALVTTGVILLAAGPAVHRSGGLA